ncbi:hypothetical protein DY023_04900 [Microbacterium bovistercoris]|uniref:Uncharacterized protein n=1 Tax=Microbacterium bovistercoris TaxID=2293570 RepID=A0A371NVZ9_9MICO|nr:hypothetical protein [Microbacterium bovistercoris]REJ06912.1 hypothetical protein DY023_04900 [Microbacterium bovistercoris]
MRKALAPFAPVEVWKDLAQKTASRWGCLFAVLSIASFVFPVLALLLLLGWAFGANDIANVGYAGVLTVIAAAVSGSGIRDDIRRRDTSDVGTARLLGLFHGVPSTLGLVLAVAAIVQGEAEGAIGIAGIALDAAVGWIPFFVYRPPAHAGTARWQRHLARLEQARDNMPEEERTRVVEDLQMAFRELEKRGLVPEQDLLRARQQQVGMLGIVMALREGLKSARD